MLICSYYDDSSSLLQEYGHFMMFYFLKVNKVNDTHAETNVTIIRRMTQIADNVGSNVTDCIAPRVNNMIIAIDSSEIIKCARINSERISLIFCFENFLNNIDFDIIYSYGIYIIILD